MTAPRIASRALPPDTAFDEMARQVDNLGVAARLILTSPIATPANVGSTIYWNKTTFDTRGDMWDPAEPWKLTVRVTGTYYIELKIRFSGSVGAASNTGQRICYLFHNGNQLINIKGHDREASYGDWEGVTLCCSSVVDCQQGDYLFAVMQSTTAVVGGHQDYGGTYLFVTRFGAIGSAGAGLQSESVGLEPEPLPDFVFGPDVVAAPQGVSAGGAR